MAAMEEVAVEVHADAVKGGRQRRKICYGLKSNHLSIPSVN